ncbi:MAG: hypothetical protein Q9227_001790 [Pyrenula ochraceoflavens]
MIDQISSYATTPSGMQTPQPEFSDKRLPGISHSYFGQVGSPHSPKSTSQNFHTMDDRDPFPQGSVDKPTQPIPNADPKRSLSVSERLSSHELENQKEHTPPLLPNEQPPKPGFYTLAMLGESRLPPTPVSSGSSTVQKETEAVEKSNAPIENGWSSISQALQHISASTQAPDQKPQRHASLPVSSVTTAPVLASHLSNPSSDPVLPEVPSPAPNSNEPSSSVQELTKLTSSTAAGSCPKNTPPLTPRALSREADSREKRHDAPPKSALGSPEPRSPRNNQQPQADTTSTSLRSADNLGVGLPKGKLSVKISEARGLRPSFDPYVVCVFEWNEYISKGPKNDAMDVDSGDREAMKGALSSIPIRRTDSDMGKPMAIPMKSRQGSHNSQLDGPDITMGGQVTDPQWDHEAMFDIVGDQSELDISVYDRSSQEIFLGHLRLCLNLNEEHPVLDGWFPLEARGPTDEDVTGEIHLRVQAFKTDKKHFGPSDFKILKLIGKGTFGQVYQVRKKDTLRIYAMKVLSKKVIIQKKEVAHTIGERNILVRTAMADSPFIVGLKFSFQTSTDLYLVTDFMSGGELFWHLQKEGRFQEPRAKFYIAELILALQHLHRHDIVYRDLKPENILLDANGHIALCDFGLSKANLTKNDTTNTFCGTTEYLAPEVLLDEQGYTKMVDFWSLGVLVFEMCCGWSPFYAEDTQQMYKNIAFGKVRFPRDALSTEGRNFVKGLLNRNPKHRLGANNDAQELMDHPFFQDIDWKALEHKNLVPPFKPKLKSGDDTSNFDPEFTNALNNASSLNARAAALAAGVNSSTPLSPTMQNAFKGFTFVDESSMDNNLGPRAGHLEDENANGEDLSLARSTSNQDNRMSGVKSNEENIFGQSNFDV